MTVDYTRLDAAIVADVTARPRCGYREFDTAKPLAREISEFNWDRVLDRRFQSLCKRGQLARKDGSWTLPEPPVAAELKAWQTEVVRLLGELGFSPEAAAVFASAEVNEYRRGECDCAEMYPVDMVDLLMRVAADAVERWKVESQGRVFGYRPPSVHTGCQAPPAGR